MRMSGEPTSCYRVAIWCQSFDPHWVENDLAKITYHKTKKLAVDAAKADLKTRHTWHRDIGEGREGDYWYAYVQRGELVRDPDTGLTDFEPSGDRIEVDHLGESSYTDE